MYQFPPSTHHLNLQDAILLKFQESHSIAIASSPRHAAKGPGQRAAGSSDTWTSSGTWFLWPRILKPSFKGL